MKKIFTLTMILCAGMFLAACDKEAESGKETEQVRESVTSETSVLQASEEEPEVETEQNNAKALVVYFSCTGNTEAIAEHIANATGSDIHEIIPEQPYTDADLNYNDNNSRTTKEMNDSSARPVISGSVDNFEQYETVYIGYPIWWGEAPRIMDTFVESYDFTGKKVIPFCTSGGSGIGSSAKTLEKLAGAGSWMDGKKFSGSEDADTVSNWIDGLGL